MKINLAGLLLSAIVSFSSCERSVFYEDVDDKGISRFTSQGYNVVSSYINQEPWVGEAGAAFIYPSPFPVYIQKISSSAVDDTLSIQFRGEFSDTILFSNQPGKRFGYINFSIPVSKSFSLNDFFAWQGKRFPSGNMTTTIWLSDEYAANKISGSGALYFVKILPGAGGSFIFSGLFSGNIGDSVILTKGRFDFKMDSRYHTLP